MQICNNILPVPVLADADAKGLRNAETQRAGSVGEARESNRTISLVTEGRKETANSRGGQKLTGGVNGRGGANVLLFSAVARLAHNFTLDDVTLHPLQVNRV